MRARRGLLYVPGDDLHKIQKAVTLEVDSICLDIEDGVATNRKVEARQTIAQALQSVDFGNSERLVRINPVGSGMEIEDLNSVLSFQPDGIVIPKVQDAAQVTWVSDAISQVEKKQGWQPGKIILLALIESALGVVHLAEIASASYRLRALIFGAEDLAGNIGAVRTREGWEVFYARSAVVTHASAFGLQAIDMVYLDFHDEQGLRAESLQGQQMGYNGKQLIHPTQVRPAQESFTPSDEAIAHARRILEASVSHQEAGKGAFALDGSMVDAPVVKTAQWVLARAHAAGKDRI
jgi:citrate lyase beta subunit